MVFVVAQGHKTVSNAAAANATTTNIVYCRYETIEYGNVCGRMYLIRMLVQHN